MFFEKHIIFDRKIILHSSMLGKDLLLSNHFHWRTQSITDRSSKESGDDFIFELL
jgi:hypothetical protein